VIVRPPRYYLTLRSCAARRAIEGSVSRSRVCFRS